MARKKELLRMAETIAEAVTKQCERHELCFLNQAVQMFVSGF